MRQVSRSAIVPYPPLAMYELVADVEAYPQFLPGCSAARVQSRSEDELVGSLTLARGPLHTTFTTRNRLAPPDQISMQLIDGAFRDLRGEWGFAALGEQGCRVTLELAFEFANPVKDMLLGPAFEGICNQLVDAFVERARRVYGKPA
jgi:ribosome-associated toxin RatA of RatAB toxin-antitoxin module